MVELNFDPSSVPPEPPEPTASRRPWLQKPDLKVVTPPIESEIEIPSDVVDAIASWRRTLHNAQGDKEGPFRRAALELMQLSAKQPDQISQVIADELHDIAEASGINADAAQKIMSDVDMVDDHPLVKLNATAEKPSTDRSPLLLQSWLDRVLPPRDYLLGEVLCTTSRWLIYGATGVGKTLFSAEMAGAIAAGSFFLGWAGRRPARVMYLDGELPAETFNERMQLVAEHFGADIPLYGYSRDVLTNDDMPPLNTEEGERWLEREIETVRPDAIFFDSIMSLLVGNMSDEESWAPLKPLIRRLSARRIAQVWIHHTGHDTSKGYGTKTREWELDTVLALTPASDDGATIYADFTKARLRTPATRDQFKARNLTRGPAGWAAVDADVSRGAGSKATEVAQVRRAIIDAYDRMADGINLVPGFDDKPVRKVGVDAIRDEVKSRGFLDVGEKGALTTTARSIFRRAKTSLLSTEQLMEDDDLIWRP